MSDDVNVSKVGEVVVSHNDVLNSEGVVFVSGGNRGIGLVVAKSLVAKGYKVVIGSRDGVSVDGLPAVPLDMLDPVSISSACALVKSSYGPISILVANAGIVRDSLLMRMSDVDLDEVIETNLTGNIRLVRAVLPGMIKQLNSRIILISSVSAFMGPAGQVNYAASKAGLLGAARSLAREVGSKGVTVNVVAPGFISTDMTSTLNPAVVNTIKAMTPLARLGSPSDVANVVCFLASPESSFITGTVIPVDGGLSMGA